MNTRELDQLTTEGGLEVCRYLLDKIATKVDRLQAIVDKLEKCWRLDESGKLVRDEPMVPGMTVSSILGEQFCVGGVRYRTYATRPSEAFPDPRGLYATDAAAEAARMKHCPVCGAELEEGPREDGYTGWACGSNKGAWGFGRSQACRERKEAAEAAREDGES